MKKSVLVIVSMFVLSGVAFSSEINAKIRLGCFGEAKTNGTRTLTVSQKSKEMLAPISTINIMAYALAAEWLFPLNDLFKLGAGLEYVPLTGFDCGVEEKSTELSYLPIYFTMQVNPVSLAEGAFLLKVILGMRGFLVMRKIW